MYIENDWVKATDNNISIDTKEIYWKTTLYNMDKISNNRRDIL